MLGNASRHLENYATRSTFVVGSSRSRTIVTERPKPTAAAVLEHLAEVLNQSVVDGKHAGQKGHKQGNGGSSEKAAVKAVKKPFAKRPLWKPRPIESFYPPLLASSPAKPPVRLKWAGRGHAKTTATNTDEPRRKLLRPAVLSERLKVLSDAGKLDEAVSMLESSPLDAQNARVWNTLMSEAMKVERYRLAYDLYTDMKRRGLKPTLATYSTMLSGLSKIAQWDKFTKQLGHAESIYQHFLRDASNFTDPKEAHFLHIPTLLYMRILDASNQHQKMFDIFYDMEETGPLAPNEYIFGALFRGLSHRKHTEKNDNLSVTEQNASDAKLLWRQMVKASEKNGFPIDSFVVTSALRVLWRGRPTDHAFALDIVHEYLGLARPGEEPLPAKTPLSKYMLEAAVELCVVAQKYRLGIHFVQQVMDRRELYSDKEVLGRQVMEKRLILYASLTATGSLNEPAHALETIKWMLRNENVNPQLRPEKSTYNLALMACWRGGDWATAMDVFEVMTRLDPLSFHDSAVQHKGAADEEAMAKRETERERKFMSWYPTQPNAQTMSCLVRTAWKTHDRANMRQCLRIAAHYGPSHFFNVTSVPSRGDAADERYMDYYRPKLASDLVRIVNYELEGREARDDEDSMRWRDLRDSAHQALRAAGKAPQAYVPQLERQATLGSHSGLEMMQEAIDFQMATRS